jgi:hypothetical protein
MVSMVIDFQTSLSSSLLWRPVTAASIRWVAMWCFSKSTTGLRFLLSFETEGAIAVWVF